MKEYFEEKERRGLPGGPNEMFTYVTGVFSSNAPMSDIFQAPSDIEGDGMFAGRSFKQGELIGLAHKGGQPVTQLGKMHNHNEESPTMMSKKVGDQRFVYALKDLKEGEELTTNYRMQPELEQPEQFQQGGTITQAPSMLDNFKSDIRSFVRYPFATIKEKFNTGNVPYNFDKGIDAGQVEKDSFTSAIDFFNPINAAYKSADSLDSGDYSNAALNALSIIPFAKPLKAIKGVTPLQAKLAAKTINKGSKASQLQDGGDPERSKGINDIDYSKYNVRVIQYPYGSKKFSPGHIEAVLINTDTGDQVNVIPGTKLVGRVNRWSTGSGNKRVSERDYKGKDDVRVLDLDLSDDEIKGFINQAQLFEGTERSSIHDDVRLRPEKLPISLEDESIYNYDFLDSNCATGVCLALGMDPNSPENSRGGITDPNFVMDNILENYSDKIVPGSVKGKRTSRFEGLTKLVKEEAKVDLNATTINLLTNYLDGLDRDEINDVVETVLHNPTAIEAIKDKGIGDITEKTLKDLDTVISGFLPFGDNPSEHRQNKAAKRLRQVGSDAKEIYNILPDGTIPAALKTVIYERDKWAPELLDMAKDKANRFAIEKLGIDVPNIDISMEGIKNIPNYWKDKLGFQEGGDVNAIQRSNPKTSFLSDLEKLINASLDNVNDRAQAFAENPGEENSIDNMRHAAGGRYAAEAIQQKVKDIPYVGGLLDSVGVDKAAGFIGSNLLGVGHELRTIFGGDERPFLAKLLEMGEDTFNNYVGSIVGSLNIDDSKKDEVIKYLSYNNLLPDGYVRTKQGETEGLSENVYFKDKDGNVKGPEYKKGGSVSWQWKGKTYSGTLIPSMENEKNRYARTENGKIKTLPKGQDGGSMSNPHAIYKHYINGNFKTKQEEIIGQKVYDKLNRVYYRDAKAMNMSPANYIMTYVAGNS